MTKYFGTDGVRGVANQTLKPEMAFKLGRCGGYVLSKKSKKDAKVIVARDTRASGEMLISSLISGLLSVGVQVEDAGIITTPAVSYLIKKFNFSAGIMVSASHNPASDNGIKFFGNDGNKLSDSIEDEIEGYLDAPKDELPRPSAEGLGYVSPFPSALTSYLDFLKNYALDYKDKFKIVVDTANGAGSSVAPKLLAGLDISHEVINKDPDGLNINLGVGSTHPESLIKAVKKGQFDAGFAIDGDGDRCIAVDEDGNIIDGDKIMYIIAKFFKENGELNGDTVVTTVMSNIGLYKALKNADIKFKTTTVGDRYVSEEMNAHGFVLGGEQSGHIILRNYHNTGDGLLTMIMLLNVMFSENKSLKELARPVNTYPQKLVNVIVKDKNAWQDSTKLAQKIKQIENEMGEDGRVLIRPSGTENLLRVMVEAKSDQLVNEYVDTLVEVVEQELS